MKEQHRARLRGAQAPFSPEAHPLQRTPDTAPYTGAMKKAKRVTRAALLPLLMLSLTACDLFGGPNPPPSDRPSVTAVSPADGEQDVALDEAVVATLNLPNSAIDESTVGNSTVTLTQAGEEVAVSATPVVSGSTITLTPDESLEPETTYTFSIDASVADESGETLAEAFSSTFTTGDGETDTGEPTLPEANLEANAERLIFETQNAQTSEAQTLTISNTGDAAFTLSSLEPTDSQFVLTNTPTLPATIEAGQSVDVQVAFEPTSLGPKEATLTVNGDSSLDTDLRGLSVKGNEGDNEPSLQWIFDTFDLSIETGDEDPTTTTITSNASSERLNSALGDEQIVQTFEKAGSGNVTVEVLAAYGVNQDPVVEFGYHEAGNGESRTKLFDVESGAENAQTLNPEIDGDLSFDPGDTSFGFYSFWQETDFFTERYIYTQDSLNDFETKNDNPAPIPHHVRAYPLPGERNAYVLATEEFTRGFDYNDIVVIVRNVRPAGPGGLSCNQNEPVISSRVLSESYGNFELQNPSGAPFADRLVFSRIGDISQETFSDRPEQFPFANLKCHTLNVVQLKNTSGSPLEVSGLTITDDTSSSFILPGGGSSFTIDANDTQEVLVEFIESGDGNSETKDRGVYEATLQMQVGGETVNVELAGIYQRAPEGSNEVYLGGVVEAFGYSTNMGTDSRGGIKSADPDVPPPSGSDEVRSKFWERAETDEPVYIRQIAAFHSCCTSGTADDLRILEDGNETAQFKHAPVYGQSVLPPKQNSETEAAEMTFTPNGPFELVVRNAYSTDWTSNRKGNRNNGNLGVRFWPAIRDGNVIDNTYIVAQDFVQDGCGSTDTANCDFNDNMYLITNVSPVAPE